MSRPAVISLSVAILLLGLSGCRPVTDLGVPCWLVKGEDAAGDPVYITNGELVAGLEYISQGGECEFWTCVRDADHPDPTTGPGERAEGYCSAPCIPQDGPLDSNPCIPADRAHEDPESPEHLTCRAVSLDPELLAYFRDNDPEQYRRLFGDSTTPYYCARGDGVR